MVDKQKMTCEHCNITTSGQHEVNCPIVKQNIEEELETIFHNSFRLAKVELEETKLKKVLEFFKLQINKII